MSKNQNTELPTWDLGAIYSSSEDWENDFKRLPALANTFESFRGHLKEENSKLLEALEASDTYSRTLEKLYSYAMMKTDEDTRISENQSRLGRLQTAYASQAGQLAWFTPEFLGLPQETINSYLSAPELRLYQRSLHELLRNREHTLSTVEEQLLGQLSEVLCAASHTFSALNNSDLTFGKVKNEEGKMIELTHGTYLPLMECPNRDVRKKTFTKLYNTYEKFRNTFASTLDTTVKHHVTSARIRHFSDALSAALHPDNIPAEVYHNLIEAVHSRLDHLHHYLNVRKKILKQTSFDMWDIFTPLFPEFRMNYTWDEAVKCAKDALRPMGKEYGKIFDLAFTQHWIDVPERKGKRSGAYSGGCYDTYPYILLNFQGTLNDVFTLVHEGGHSMHSYYSRKTQPYIYSDYKIFVAEVASTTNEILLAEHLLSQSNDPKLKAYLLTHLIDEIRATVIRQTMFAEFELFMHNTVEAGGTLTADILDKKYYELNNQYHGFNAHPLIAKEWERIPHFYYNFYVYKYATGMAAAVKLANGILHGGPDCLHQYIDFLKAGSSKDVLDILKDAGADMSSPAPVINVLDYFGNLVNQLENLIQKG